MDYIDSTFIGYPHIYWCALDFKAYYPEATAASSKRNSTIPLAASENDGESVEIAITSLFPKQILNVMHHGGDQRSV